MVDCVAAPPASETPDLDVEVDDVDEVDSVEDDAVSLASAFDSVAVADASVAWAVSTLALRSARSSDASVWPDATFWPTTTSTELTVARHIES